MHNRLLHIAVLTFNLICISIRNNKESGYGRAQNILESIKIGSLVIILADAVPSLL